MGLLMRTPRKRIAFPTPRRRVRLDTKIQKANSDKETKINSQKVLGNENISQKKAAENKLKHSDESSTNKKQKAVDSLHKPSKSKIAHSNSNSLPKRKNIKVSLDEAKHNISKSSESISENSDRKQTIAKKSKSKKNQNSLQETKHNSSKETIGKIPKKNHNFVTYSQNDKIMEISADSQSLNNSMLNILTDMTNGLNSSNNIQNNKFYNKLTDSVNNYLEKISRSRLKEQQVLEKLSEKSLNNNPFIFYEKFLGLKISRFEDQFTFVWSVNENNVEKYIEFSLFEENKEFTYKLLAHKNIDLPETFTCVFTFDDVMLTRFMFNIFEIILSKSDTECG